MKDVNELYQEAMRIRNQIQTHKEIVKMKESEYQDCIKQYRIESVCRVLDHIRTEYRNGKMCDLESLLCHCQNKLHGNIDGTELTLREGKPFSFEKGDEDGR